METKHAIYTVLGVGAAGALAFFAWKKWGGLFTAASGADNGQAAAPAAPPAPPSFTPSAQTYAPIAVGINTNGNSTPPPGVPAAQVSTPPVEHGNAAVLPHHEGPNANDVTGAAGAALVNGTGLASIPTGGITSAPAAVGNADVIDAEYVKVFGRHADNAGMAFWKTALDNGTIAAADLDKNLIRGAQGSDIGAAVMRQPQLYVSSYQP